MSKDLLALQKGLRLLGAAVILFLAGCAAPTDNSLDPAIIKGTVADQTSLSPLVDALIQALPFAENAQTNVNGEFTLSIQMPDSTPKVVTIIISRTGFVRDTLPGFVIQAGKTVTVPDVRMTRLSGNNSGGASGTAKSIVLVDVETANIFVTGTGGNTTSDLFFEVRDSTGAPIDNAHQVTVAFRIAGGPGGGETIAPASAKTNAVGRVTTTVNSGTIAGPIQVVATIQALSLSSAPVPLAIHGGLPDLTHFSVVPANLNFAGYNIFGLDNAITAFVGDRYSNPVPPGTAVQFRSTGGIVGGSGVTDARGRATVTLISAAPQPQGIAGAPFPFNQRGFARVTAETVDENRQKITASTVVLFSGVTQVSVSPLSFTLEAYKSQVFTYTVSDQNLNPLVAGSSYAVSSNAGDVAGDTQVIMGDTQSRDYTNFSFVLTNSRPDSVKAKDATVVIQVTSPNGNISARVTGTMLPDNP